MVHCELSFHAGPPPGDSRWPKCFAAPHHSPCLVENQSISCLWKGQLCRGRPGWCGSLEDNGSTTMTCMCLLAPVLIWSSYHYILLLVLVLSKLSVRSIFTATLLGETAAIVLVPQKNTWLRATPEKPVVREMQQRRDCSHSAHTLTVKVAAWATLTHDAGIAKDLMYGAILTLCTYVPYWCMVHNGIYVAHNRHQVAHTTVTTRHIIDNLHHILNILYYVADTV